MKAFFALLFSTALLFVGQFAQADLSSGSCSDAQKNIVTTSHQTTIAGKIISYSATVGFIEVTAQDNISKACIFYTSYTVTPNAGEGPRPITFAFNGGPGSASLWLHLGFMGPMKVDMGSDGLSPSMGGLIVNDNSPLDVTDIVMIDPVATGFSHTEDQATGNSQNNKFFGVKNDYTSIGAFIRNYLNTYNRWPSAKFILGESYGGIRGSLLTQYLQSELMIQVSGLILISPALSDTTFFGVADNTVPYWTYLPNFAATAWYHKKVATKYQRLTVESIFIQAKQFAETRYRDALDEGSDISDEDLNSVAQELSDYTGISKDKIIELNLRVSDDVMFSELLRNKGLDIGRFDSRFTEPKNPSKNEWSDPSSNLLDYPFNAGINQYLRVDLNVQTPAPYAVYANIDVWPSMNDWGGGQDVMENLAQALSVNPHLNVMIASGYYDLACPMGTVEYEISQMPGGKLMSSRIQLKKYDGGHMMYINPVAATLLKSDISQFIKKQLK